MKMHKYTKVADWIAVIEAWKKSGLPQKQFCQQNNISNKTFYRWHCKLRQSKLATQSLVQAPLPNFKGFIPVTVNEGHQKAPTLEQHCTLLFNDQLQLQIPIKVMNANFLRMLIEASGARAC